jgi:SOS-response transcriptional repressor LexA
VTPRQAEVLAEIETYMNLWGIAPTVRELSVLLGISTTAVHKHLVAMRAEGVIEWNETLARTLRVVKPGGQ